MKLAADANEMSKTDRVQAELLRLASIRGPGIKLPTIKEMCEQFDVARGTLERAMVGLEGRGLLCRKHGSGIYVSEAIRHKTVGVVFGGDIFSEAFSPFWGLLLSAVRQEVATRDDLRLQAYMDISQGHDGLAGHAQLVEDIEAERLHGLLLFADSPAEVQQLARHGIPLVVAFDLHTRESLDRCGAVTRRAAGELAARGCRRVAYLATNRDGLEELATEMKAAGIADAQVIDWTYGTWLAEVAQPGCSHEKLGRQLMARMIANAARTPLPDAIASLQDDTMTRGAITALLQAGLKPGRDLTIVAQTNRGSPVLEPYAEDLVQIELDPAAIVRKALSRLETMMGGGSLTQSG